MKRILFTPVQTAALSLATMLLGSGIAAFSLKGEEGSPPVFSATADKTSVSIGDRVVVTYTARIPAGSSLVLESLVTPAPEEGTRPPGGAILEFEAPSPARVTKSKAGDFLEWSQPVALFPFATGTVRVPGPHYTLEESSSSSSAGHTFDVRPPAVELTVASRLPKDQKPEEIAPKNDKPVRIPAWPAKYWIAAGAGVALAASLVAWLMMRRRKPAPAAPEEPAVPPGEELRLALARLADVAEGLTDDARGFYSDLTHAVKRFLERATGEPVLEWTTFETVRRLREKGYEFPREAAFPDLLGAADRVKFGKGVATREDARQALSRARVVLEDVEARQRVMLQEQKAREAVREKANETTRKRAAVS